VLTKPESTGADSPPTEEERTIGHTVPAFFQEEDEPALRSQAQWLEQHLGLSDEFFARFLRISESSFRDWRLEQAPLSPDRQDALRGLWRTVLHLRSFTNYDDQRIRGLLERQIPIENEWGYRHPNTPPWSGSYLRSYLEERGADVLPDVDGWLLGFRFGNPYAS
jgi:hypothetical protein